MSLEPAAIAQPTPQVLALSGSWTTRGIGTIEHQLESVHVPSTTEVIADGARIEALDSAGAWVLQKLLLRLRGEGIVMITHDLDLLWQVADRVAVLAEGKLQGIGSMFELSDMDRPAIRKFFDGSRGRAAQEQQPAQVQTSREIGSPSSKPK